MCFSHCEAIKLTRLCRKFSEVRVHSAFGSKKRRSLESWTSQGVVQRLAFQTVFLPSRYAWLIVLVFSNAMAVSRVSGVRRSGAAVAGFVGGPLSFPTPPRSPKTNSSSPRYMPKLKNHVQIGPPHGRNTSPHGRTVESHSSRIVKTQLENLTRTRLRGLRTKCKDEFDTRNRLTCHRLAPKTSALS